MESISGTLDKVGVLMRPVHKVRRRIFLGSTKPRWSTFSASFQRGLPTLAKKNCFKEVSQITYAFNTPRPRGISVFAELCRFPRRLWALER